MIQVLKSLPRRLYVAVSGGVDSSVLLHLLSKNRDVCAAHYVHDSHQAEHELQNVRQICHDLSVPLVYTHQPKLEKSGNMEAQWRKGRMEFLHGLNDTVCVGTNLDDAVEWYLLTALKGEGHYMEYESFNVVKPLLLTPKVDIVEYAHANGVIWREDPTNCDVNFATRNRIRHNLMPEALLINPGLYKTVKNRIFEKTFKL